MKRVVKRPVSDCFLWTRAGSLFVSFYPPGQLLSEKEERRFFAYFLAIQKVVHDFGVCLKQCGSANQKGADKKGA